MPQRTATAASVFARSAPRAAARRSGLHDWVKRERCIGPPGQYLQALSGLPDPRSQLRRASGIFSDRACRVVDAFGAASAELVVLTRYQRFGRGFNKVMRRRATSTYPPFSSSAEDPIHHVARRTDPFRQVLLRQPFDRTARGVGRQQFGQHDGKSLVNITEGELFDGTGRVSESPEQGSDQQHRQIDIGPQPLAQCVRVEHGDFLVGSMVIAEAERGEPSSDISPRSSPAPKMSRTISRPSAAMKRPARARSGR